MRALGLALAVLTVGGASAPAPAPAAAEPVVVTADDAVHAQAGRDFTRLASVRLDRDTWVTEVTAAGQVVIAHYTDHGYRFTMLDPETGRRTSLPAPGDYASIVRIDADTFWYAATTRVEGRTTVYRYDRGTQRMRSFLLPDGAGRVKYHDRVIGLDGNTIWYTSGPAQEHSSEDVFTVRFAKPGTLTKQARHKGNPLFVDGVLAWSEYDYDGPSHLAMRDVATGEITRAELPAGCVPRGDRVQSNGSQFVLVLSCDAPEIEAIVVERSGEISTVIQVAMDDGSLGTTDRGAFFYDLFYDFATGRLLDFSDIPDAEISPTGGPGAHPVQVWPQRDGRALVVRLK